MNFKKIFSAAVFFIPAALLISCASAPSTENIPAVREIDFGIFEDKWYEISRIPIGIAEDWVGTTDTYIKNNDGTWLVLYEGFKGGFDGKEKVLKQKLKLKDPEIQGEMSARPFPFIWLPYRLIYWNEADRTMIVTSGTMDYLWLMAKDPVPSDEVYKKMTDISAKMGFDINRLERVPQKK